MKKYLNIITLIFVSNKLFSIAKVPIDIIGTGSYIPDFWEETYATSDIIRYNGKNLVKKGREFLFKNK